MPKPKTDESKDDFVKRCMADDVMNAEFEDEDQRLAVCNDLWDKREENSAQPSERRMVPLNNLRAIDKSDGPMLTGYAAVFDKLSEEMWGFREKIDAGAFKETIKDDDIRFLFNHSADFVLGRNKAGTLELEEDKQGLAFKNTMPETTWARDLRESIRRGDINQCSFQFDVLEDSWHEDKKKETVTRTLHKVRLYDVSIVTFPAYPQTSVDLRALLNEGGVDPDHLTKVLMARKAGLSISPEDQTWMAEARGLIFDTTEGRGANPGKPNVEKEVQATLKDEDFLAEVDAMISE
jgi:HK97 family phage prohead protease